MNLFGQSPTRKAADEILSRLAKHLPDVHPNITDRPRTYPSPPNRLSPPGKGGDGVRVEVPGRWVMTLDNVDGGVQVQVLRPHLPGREDAAFRIQIYNYESMANLLWRYSLGTVTIYDMRVDAVYEVLGDFTDFYGYAFTTGTRLTFVERHFLPYEDGHTVIYRECSLYLRGDSEVVNHFDQYFGYAASQTPSGEWPPRPDAGRAT